MGNFVRTGDAKAQGERLIFQLEQDILAGVWPPGTWLRQIELQKRYDTHRFHIRQALEILAQRQVVRYIERRGFYVQDLDRHTLHYLQELLTILESSAAAMLINADDTDSLQQLRQHVLNMEQALTDHDFYRHRVEDTAFHRQLYSSCPNAILSQLITETHQRLPIASLYLTPPQIHKITAQHYKIISYLEQGNLKSLKRLLYYHYIG